MTKIIKNTHSYFRSTSMYKSLLGMRKQQMHSSALGKCRNQLPCSEVPQPCESRHPTCFSMLMLHNLCCSYFCSVNWAQWRFWMGRIRGWNSCQTQYSLKGIPTKPVTLFPRFVIKCTRKTASSVTPHCFQNSAWASCTLLTTTQSLFLRMSIITLQKCF